MLRLHTECYFRPVKGPLGGRFGGKDVLQTMMNGKFRLVAGLGLLGLAFGASAQVTKTAKGYVFRQAYPVGKTLVFNMNGDLGFGGQSFKMASPTKVKTVSKKGDVYTLEVTSGPMTMNGKAQSMNGQAPKATTSTMKITSAGKIVDGAAKGPYNIMGGMTMPEKPLKVGDKWTGNMNMPQMGGGAVKATYNFIGLKTINGKQVAQIGVNLVASGMGEMKGTGTMNILVADGLPLTSLIKIGGNFSAGSQGGGKVSSTINIVRQ